MIAKELGINLSQVEDVITSAFAYQALVMKEKCDREKLEFPSVRVPYWGIFYCPPYTKHRLMKLNNKQNGSTDTTSGPSETEGVV